MPALFVPFARATHDHQTWNARALADQGAALLLPESELANAEPRLRLLLETPGALATMAAAFAPPGPDAAQICAQAVFALEQRRPAKEIIKEFADVS